MVVVLVLIAAVILLWAIASYNGLIQLRNRIDNAWSQIDVQLKRRFDLIPNLVETVKGYAAHEKETFEMVTRARAQMDAAGSVTEVARAQGAVESALRSIFAVAEAYPELKANQNFLMLQEELSGTESKIAYARQFYNDTVLKYDTRIQTFPSSIIAGAFGFKARDYFELEEAARQPVHVRF